MSQILQSKIHDSIKALYIKGKVYELLSLYLKEENREFRYLPALIVRCMEKDFFVIQTKSDELVDLISNIPEEKKEKMIVKIINNIADFYTLKWLVDLVIKMDDRSALYNVVRARMASRDSKVLYRIIDKICNKKIYMMSNASIYSEHVTKINQNNDLTEKEKKRQLKVLKDKNTVHKTIRNKAIRDQLKRIIVQLNKLNAVNATVVIKAYELIKKSHEGANYPEYQDHLMKVLKGVDVRGIECEQDCPQCEKILMCTLRLMYYNGLKDLSDAKTKIKQDYDCMQSYVNVAAGDNTYVLSGDILVSLKGKLNDLDRGNDSDCSPVTRGR